ncbi:MAG TPA: hypothetical protein DIC53_00505 [Synergistaceae bacterium]|jgi:hypothetical protein|nr:hypothetical protein [Synergistaceae bacterium]
MYLFWKRNAGGSITLSQEGIVQFVNSFLEKPYVCTHIALSSREDCLFPVIAFPQGSSAADMSVSEAKVKAALSAMGLCSKISWSEMKPNAAEPANMVGSTAVPSFAQRPLVWGLLGAGLSVLVSGGLGVLLWAVFWGLVLYLGALFVRSDRGKHLLKRLRSALRR